MDPVKDRSCSNGLDVHYVWLKYVTFQRRTSLDRYVLQVIQTIQQVLCCGLSWWSSARPQHQHLQLLHGHRSMFCLDVVQIFGLQPQLEGRLLPLLSQRLGHLQELLLGQILPYGADFCRSRR